ncbi:MAG: peptidoglycan-binding protein [Clostridiales bacterium]|jgi:peptidoglycan hydrolase-like protein with peptidoglycan-binding domain|nr:peptidoglycan-binding protein [Clostridiales bacterium]
MRADCSNAEIAIRQLQTWLRALAHRIPGMTKVNVTGIYDAQTERAVREFQMHSKITPTGAVDFSTWEKIKAEYNKIRKIEENEKK